MSEIRQKDSTSQTIYVFIRNKASTPVGMGLTGLAFGTAGLNFSYVRDRSARVAITLVTQTNTGAYSSGGFVEVDSTNTPGLYRLDVPNAALVTGVNKVRILWTGANSFDDGTEIDLTTDDPYAGGLTLAQITGAVWNELRSAHTTSGTFGEGVASVIADCGITQAGADKVWASTTRTLSAFSTALALSVWNVLDAGITTASSVGLRLKGLTFTNANKVDASLIAAGDFPQAAADKVWTSATRVVTDKTGYSLSASGMDAALDAANGVETGMTIRGMWRLVSAALFGKSSGVDTGSPIYRAAVSDTKARITSTSVLGNRSAVTTDQT
jgi:hypothetical protein